jgi:hypothetical protein
MAGCEITPLTPPKACSGKCMGGACGKSPNIWVVAACEGMVSLFEKNKDGTIHQLQHASPSVFPSIKEFQSTIEEAEERHTLDQLVIVGSGSDIAWMHASLSPQISRHIAAEIEYPLMAGWFKEQPHMGTLTNALGHLLSN